VKLLSLARHLKRPISSDHIFLLNILSNCFIFQVNLEKPFINRRGREVEVVIEGEKNGQTYVSFFSEDGRKKGYTFVDKNQITYKKVFSKKHFFYVTFMFFFLCSIYILLNFESINNSFNIVNIHVTKNEKVTFYLFDYVFNFFNNNN